MSSTPNGFGHGHGHREQDREEDDEKLSLDLSLATSTPNCHSQSQAPSMPSSVSLPSPSPPPPPPPLQPFISSPPLYHHHHQTHQYFTGPIPSPPPPPPPSHLIVSGAYVGANVTSPRTRRSPVQTLKPGKTETVKTPFRWATNKRATIRSFDYLISKQMTTISGDVQCKRCEKMYQMEYDLREKFLEIGKFIAENKSAMHDRAPAVWMNPNLPSCKFCGQSNCVKPLIKKKKTINWLFLLLGQMLGCCKLEQLKYFCKHTRNHRTGAKDRVLYLTYLGLCKQLDPAGPFDV